MGNIIQVIMRQAPALSCILQPAIVGSKNYVFVTKTHFFGQKPFGSELQSAPILLLSGS
jgi:hypothetical protein